MLPISYLKIASDMKGDILDLVGEASSKMDAACQHVRGTCSRCTTCVVHGAGRGEAQGQTTEILVRTGKCMGK